MLMRIFKTFLGSLIAAAGIVIFLKANMGADPLSVFLLGLINQTGEFLGRSTFGSFSTGFGILVLTTVFFIDRPKVGIGSIINSLSIGMFINLLYFIGFDSIVPNIPLLDIILGPVVLGFGLAVYLSADLGAGSTEAIMLIIVERTGISLKYIRIAQDALFVILGVLLGAPIGLGLVTGVLLIGPSIEYSLKLFPKKEQQLAI